MASRKMELKKEHVTFNIPVKVISEQEAKDRIIKSLLDTKQVTEGDGPVDNTNLQSALDDPSKVRTFKGVAYSGKPIAKHFMFENLYLDVDGMTFKEQIPIFKNHDPSSIIGFGRLSRENGELLIEGTLATELENAKEVSALADAGFNWELSVGVEPEYIEEISSDKEFSINGQNAKGKAFIFRNPTVMETSFVPIGADRNTSAQVFNKDLNKFKQIEVRNMDVTTIKVDGKDVEVSKNAEGKFSVSLEIDAINKDVEYKFCPCMESEELEDEETEKAKKSLSDENASLLEEIKELRAKNKEYEKEKKRAKFSNHLSGTGIELSDEEFEALNLLPEESANSLLSKLSNSKIAKTNPVDANKVDQAMFKQDSPKDDESFNTTRNPLDETKNFNARARKLVEEYKAEGKVLKFSDAQLMVGRDLKHY